MSSSSKRVLVLGGAGFLGSHVVDLLVEAGHDVFVLDDLSTCWLDEETAEFPRFARLEVKSYRWDPVKHGPPDSLVVLSMRHPLEPERSLYRTAFEGYVVQTVRLVMDLLDVRALKRVVVASTEDVLEDAPRGRPDVFLARCLHQALVYWHRPPALGIYFVHLPELEGERRLPDAPIPEGARTAPVEEGAKLIAALATDAKHRKSSDVFLNEITRLQIPWRVTGKDLEVGPVVVQTTAGPRADDFPPTGTRCSICGEAQHDTPGGPCCVNGHGGAEACDE